MRLQVRDNIVMSWKATSCKELLPDMNVGHITVLTEYWHVAMCYKDPMHFIY